MEQSSVADAVRRAADGDRAAWDALVANFSGLVWSVALGHRLGPADSAEVVQTTWLRLLENLDRIREPERIGGWLATTARHESLRLLRMRSREHLTDDEASFDATTTATSAAASPEELLLDRDRDRSLWIAFSQLPERCRALLRLVIIVAPPYTEVAAALDMPIGSIGPTRARCLDRLRRLLATAGVTDAIGGSVT
ncbi:RNA polymerase sigma factor [Pseudonocardia sp. TRM90224]|uniref:RNA polymerase sigma factor n=1 Tax=Pseudonocardia sp. TRM90224 TaxID=2812678 RepID=UPI001E5CE80F|nr:sigma-70 family RNA polymerase sigma factor [Pseudonocardia sp. TRM90224]